MCQIVEVPNISLYEHASIYTHSSLFLVYHMNN